MIEKAKQLAEVFAKNNVEYLFIGKFAAMLYGYPGTTQDIDIFPSKSRLNGNRIVRALKELGFRMNKELKQAIIDGKDFIQLRGGPFPLDIVFAPDGIDSFDKTKKQSHFIDNKFPCASITHIIASKRAAKRQRDKEELPRLEAFQKELEKRGIC
jgi:hypothetical protein